MSYGISAAGRSPLWTPPLWASSGPGSELTPKGVASKEVVVQPLSSRLRRLDNLPLGVISELGPEMTPKGGGAKIGCRPAAE